MRYKSRINTFQKVMCILVCGLILIAIIMNPLSSGIASFIIGSVLLYILLHEYYEIRTQYLIIKKGLETSQINILNIELLNIVKVRKLIYVEIVSNNIKIAVKPIEIEQFIQHLIQINPNIQVQNLKNEMEEPIQSLINETLQ